MIYFYLENLFFYFINRRHPLHILVPGERLVFFIFDGVMYTYTYIKNDSDEISKLKILTPEQHQSIGSFVLIFNVLLLLLF